MPDITFNTTNSIKITTTNGAYITNKVIVIKDLTAPYITDLNPGNGAINVASNANIVLKIVDNNKVISNSIVIKINSVEAFSNGAFLSGYDGSESSISNIPKGFKITIDPVSNFVTNQVIVVSVKADDGVNTLITNYSFKITSGDIESPSTVASIKGGIYVGPQKITLTAVDNYDPNPKIYYTDDGSTPTTNSKIYIGPIIITKETILKFFSRDSSGNSESIKTEVYKIIKTPENDVAVYNNFLDLSKEDSEVRIVFAKGDNAEINIYNIRGNLIKKFPKKVYSDNSYEKWNGKNEEGKKVEAGIYIIHIKGNNSDKKFRVLIVK